MKKLSNSSEDKPDIIEFESNEITQNYNSFISGNKNTVTILLIFNVLLLLVVSLVLINKMIEGSTYSDFTFLLSTGFFFLTISLSIIYLLFAFSNIINQQTLLFNALFLKENLHSGHQLYNPLEELKSLYLKSAGNIKKSVNISGISTIIFLFLLVLIYFRAL